MSRSCTSEVFVLITAWSKVTAFCISMDFGANFKMDFKTVFIAIASKSDFQGELYPAR